MAKAEGDSSVCLGIIDGCVDLGLPCFAGSNLTEHRPAWIDNSGIAVAGHGSHVASIIFGQPGSPVRGIAPGCRGLSVPIFHESVEGRLRPCSQMDLARAISLARGEGARILNISGGEAAPEGVADPFLLDAIRKCRDCDVVIVAAVGNNGDPLPNVPACLDGVLAVGAADKDGLPLGFSNWDARRKISGLLAPGVDIPGTRADGGLGTRSGTSFATPIVTGVLALLWSLLKSQRSDAKLAEVRDALIASALPCSAGEPQEQSTRMLCGRINIPGAYAILFGADLSASAILQESAGLSQTEHLSSTPLVPALPVEEELHAMTSQIENSAFDGVVPSTQTEIGGLISRLEGLVADSVRSATAQAAPPPTAQITNAAPTAMQPAAVQAAAPQAPTAPHLATAGATGSGLQPADREPGSRGVLPMEAAPPPVQATGFPENDFVTFRNSQLVFITGEIGYDFGTEARRDYFVQQFQALFQDNRLREAAEVSEGNIPLPENYKAMATYLNAGRIDPKYNATQADSNALIWTLNTDSIPIYEIRPMGNFDLIIFLTLIDFLRETAEGLSDRISVAGRILGSKRLYNGTVVPSIEPTLRGMSNWEPRLLVDLLVDQFKEDPAKIRVLEGEGEDELRERLRNFLDRIYYELRNTGQAPDERAINYLATNAFSAGEVFVEAARDKMELDKITCEQSAISRPESLCYDVLLTFFDPTQRFEKARKLYRRTVDVSDVMPVNVGSLRSWYVY